VPRYRLTIEYDGRPFVGWQIQAPGAVSVQGVLTEAFGRLTGSAIGVTGAGRTDAGVHALGQVAHVDLPVARRTDVIRDAINFHVRPWPIAVTEVDEVPDSFNARLSAIRRHYRYRIRNRRSNLALDEGRAWRVPRKLDHLAMDAAAKRLLGRHDFSTFRASECQAKSPVRTMERLDVTCDGDEIAVHAAARSFLHNQIRSIVGSLVLVGDGRWTANDLQAALEAKERSRCGPVAPPDGLYFLRVEYPAPVGA
jgi:tRNA pseudouridine38-40 synthase